MNSEPPPPPLPATKSKDSLFQDYFEHLTKKLPEEEHPLLHSDPPPRKRSKVLQQQQPSTTEDHQTEEVVLTSDNCELLLTRKFNVSALKAMAKQHRLKVSGNKQELTHRLHCHLLLSRYALRLQRVFRGHMVRRYIRLHGPKVPLEQLNNETDFVTMVPLAELSWHRRVLVQDPEKPEFVYGFDLASLLEVAKLETKTKEFSNPYNRQPFAPTLISEVQAILRLSKKLHLPLDVTDADPKEDLEGINDEKREELKALQLFQRIDALGNYSNYLWFWTLNHRGLYRFYMRLREIWEVRAQISEQTKREIVAPHGNPFQGLSRRMEMGSLSEQEWRTRLLSVIENLVTKGITTDNQVVGSYYVLGGLTLVSYEAAQSLPWLYQSFV